MSKKDKILDMPLSDRMKFYESQYESSIEPEKHIIIRIDGHKFSKYTKGFNKPFDEILSRAMELTTIDLVEEYQAVTGYTQSDEITLVIPSLIKDKRHKGQNTSRWKHQFSGRVQKMCSLIAGFTTMRFNQHLATQWNKLSYRASTNQECKFASSLNEKLYNAYFDCRMYGIESEDEVYNSVMWRVRDAEKNSRSMFAQTYCSHKQLQNMDGVTQVEFCKDTTGHDWEQIEDRYKYGILVKREKYMKDVAVTISGTFDDLKKQLDGTPSQVERTRTVAFTEKLTTYSEENIDLIMRAHK